MRALPRTGTFRIIPCSRPLIRLLRLHSITSSTGSAHMLGHHPIFGSSKTQFRGAPGILVVLGCAVVGWHFIFDSARPQDAAGLGGEKSPSWHDGIQMAFHCGPYSQPPRQLTSHQMPRSLVAAPALSFRSCNRLHGRIEPFYSYTCILCDGVMGHCHPTFGWSS